MCHVQRRLVLPTRFTTLLVAQCQDGTSVQDCASCLTIKQSCCLVQETPLLFGAGDPITHMHGSLHLSMTCNAANYVCNNNDHHGIHTIGKVINVVTVEHELKSREARLAAVAN